MQPLESSMGIPAFLSKLWKMVDDPKTDNLISWSKDGSSFIIRNEVEFWYKLLPAYYKHNNMSSFVRQLNMYGFHKVPGLDNGTVQNDKIEYQFLHSYFRRGQPQLLKNIKRKVTNSKVISSEKAVHGIEGEEQLGKVLADVKFLHGRQAQVDNVLSNLKQENSVLWRELAVLRQKHQKQQQIVNKLIQFLVTIVQPSTRMGGLGVKRRYPLMINENPLKKQKTSSSDGPTIHELDSAEMLPEELFADDSEVQEPVQAETTALNAGADKVESPASTSHQSQPKSPSLLLSEAEDMQTIEPEILLESSNLEMDKNNHSTVSVDELLSDPGLSDEAANIDSLEVNDDFEDEEIGLIDTEDSDKVFLNSSSQDTLLTNLINGSYNGDVLNSTRNSAAAKKDASAPSDDTTNMAVATRDPNLAFTRLNSVIQEDSCCSSEDMDNVVGNTQSELDQLKDFFNGCNGLDTTYLLNLFNEIPSYGLTPNPSREEGPENDLLSGSELAPYDSAIVDFNELFDDSADAVDLVKPELLLESNPDESINTPEVSNLKPTFPSGKLNNK